MNTELTPADLLERAADGFESGRYGWTKGVAYARRTDGFESYCATGALYHEAGLQQVSLIGTTEYETCGTTYREADKALEQVVENIVTRWNDYAASGVAEVIENMKEAAKNLRNKEEAR